MRRILQLVLIGASLICGSACAQKSPLRVTLGDKETKLNGELTGFDRVQYLFTANPGQHLKIQLDTSNYSNYINVRAAGAAEAVCQGSLTGNVCTIRSESASEYVIDVFLMRNAARRGEKARYILSIGKQAGDVNRLEQR